MLAVVLGSVSPAAGGASLIALFTVAVHRRSAVAIAVAALAIALLPVYFSIYPDEIPFWVNVGFATGIQAAVVGWGMLIRSQRELMLALRERTRQAEAERDLRVAQARSQERTRIAREMHDVLAHRISLLSLHAGALEVRPDAPPAEIARAAGVVRACAHEALEDLREVIGVLRTEPPDGDASARSRRSPTSPSSSRSRAPPGMAVSLAHGVDGGSLPVATGRTVYRIVQEGLTNARKHAPGAAVAVTIGGAPGDGLDGRDRQPPAAGAARPPGDPRRAARGSIGLGERVEPRRRAARARPHAEPATTACGRGCRGRHDPIRVLIVDDDALVRAGLSMMLGGAEDLEIVGEAEDGTQVIAAIDAHRPDVVLMDIRMPRMDGLAALRLVRARPAAPEVIVLTTFDVDDHVLTALRDGAAGFLVKDTPPMEILRRDPPRRRRRRDALADRHAQARRLHGRRRRAGRLGATRSSCSPS